MLRNWFSQAGIPSAAVLLLAGAVQAWPLGSALYTRGYAPYPSPSLYGYDLDEQHPGYYGGGRYREYYAFGRGPGPAVSNFPSALPPAPYWRPGKPLNPGHPPVLNYIPTVPPRDPHTCRLEVCVPADACLWMEGAQTEQTGPVRVFDSPPLERGEEYSYEIKARWNDNGKEVEQTQTVTVTAGQKVKVKFPA